MSKLVISLATRGRPAQLLDTILKSRANWTHPETVLVVACDDDDQPSIAAVLGLNPAIRHPQLPVPQTGIVLDVRPREETIAGKWNRAIEVPADVYLVAADDAPDVTPGYDSAILDAAGRFGDGIGVVYGHLANASFPGIMAPTRKFVEKLGHIFPPLFPYWFVDHWIDDIARLIDRISFADVRTDQSRAGQTQEMREPAWWANFFDAGYLLRRRIAHAIVSGEDFIETPGRKAMLLAHHPLIEFRSRWINDNVRANAGAMTNWAAEQNRDERYMRVRNAAVGMLDGILDGMDAVEVARFRGLLVPPTIVPALPLAMGFA